MAVPSEFIEELRARTTLSDLVGKRVKLVPKGGRLAGLCPFHSEKTPSFYVNDSEGFYHCFGCGVSGDAIGFLRESDGLDFMEAVRYLAEIAGMNVPNSAPVDSQKAEQRKQAIDALEFAAQFYQANLSGPVGEAASGYIKSRGLDAHIVSQFMLGYAPRSGLYPSLQQRQFPKELILQAGLAGISERDGAAYDYFRDRLMFPIQNRQGRVIAFGARALGDAQPKYLNSPEGPTFSKKAVLYGWIQARALLRQGLPLLVVEGYMDVIAVSASGVAAALAPLGTALTEQQIQLVWKLHPEPILCFDGDAAGQKAASRAIERILPLLEPGKTVRIAVMPAGQDPDDILKAEGAEGLQRILSAASGILDSLWQTKFTAYKLEDPRTQPGARAAFWADMRQLVRSISHNQTRTAYLDDVEFRIGAMRAASKGAPASGVGGYQAGQMVRTRRPKTGVRVQYQALLALLVRFPELFSDFAEELAMMEFQDSELEAVKKHLIDLLIAAPDLDEAAVRHHLIQAEFSEVVEDLFGRDMTARLGGSFKNGNAGWTAARAKEILSEIMDRLLHKTRRSGQAIGYRS
ncbi:MAG: DNA primase [Candidatus Puniceispirillaceae bacterium]